MLDLEPKTERPVMKKVDLLGKRYRFRLLTMIMTFLVSSFNHLKTYTDLIKVISCHSACSL